MFAAIKYNLAHLTDFSGRDARSTFWWYVLFLVVLQLLIGLVAAIPFAAEAIGQSIDGARAGMNEAELQAAIVANLSGSLGVQALISLALSLLMIALLAASFVRRLHDAGFSGWLALIPIACHLFSSIYGYMQMDEMMASIAAAAGASDPELTLAVQSDAARYTLVGWLGTLFVIGFGLLKSKEGSNPYGEAPVRL